MLKNRQELFTNLFLDLYLLKVKINEIEHEKEK